MFCQQCGKELPSVASVCPACGAPVPGAGSSSTSGTVDQLVADAKRAAKDLLGATAKISRYAVNHAESAGKDPSGTAKKVASRVAKELEEAAREIERALKNL